MDKNTVDWESIYRKTSGRPPRELLIRALSLFGRGAPTGTNTAIDLGSGDGTETAYLLAQGWRVLAIDSEPAAFASLKSKLPPDGQARLQTQVATFDTMTLTPADLIYAGYSVPFCPPQQFSTLWNQLVANINTGGRFAGQLFGVNDTWASNADMTFFTREQAQHLFTAFEVESFEEEDEDGQSNAGPKHWHIFHVIARKR